MPPRPCRRFYFSVHALGPRISQGDTDFGLVRYQVAGQNFGRHLPDDSTRRPVSPRASCALLVDLIASDRTGARLLDESIFSNVTPCRRGKRVSCYHERGRITALISVSETRSRDHEAPEARVRIAVDTRY